MFNPNRVEAQRWISEVAAKRATLITDTNKKVANKAITKGLEETATVDEIAGSIRKVYKEESKYRAMRMARTETVGGSNFGSLEGAKQTVNAKKTIKRWVSARDIRVRDDHANVDGQTRELEGSFSVGGYSMQHPGDRAGPPEQVIHCRCNLSYQVRHKE